jgi:hypothetical protein
MSQRCETCEIDNKYKPTMHVSSTPSPIPKIGCHCKSTVPLSTVLASVKKVEVVHNQYDSVIGALSTERATRTGKFESTLRIGRTQVRSLSFCQRLQPKVASLFD